MLFILLLEEYKEHMDRNHKMDSQFFLKKSALDGALKVFSRTLNIPFQPEMLLEDPYFSDIVGLLSNHRQEWAYFKVQGRIRQVELQ